MTEENSTYLESFGSVLEDSKYMLSMEEFDNEEDGKCIRPTEELLLKSHQLIRKFILAGVLLTSVDGLRGDIDKKIILKPRIYHGPDGSIDIVWEWPNSKKICLLNLYIDETVSWALVNEENKSWSVSNQPLILTSYKILRDDNYERLIRELLNY